jgi:hypothetical protein
MAAPPQAFVPPGAYAPPGQFAPIPPPIAPPPGVAFPAAPRAAYTQMPPAAQSYAPVGNMAASGGPMPPQMHWVVVLVVSWVTFGLAGLVWAFRQAAFVKKIDSASKATIMLAASLVLMLVQVALYFVAMSSPSSIGAMSGLIMLLNVPIVIAALMAIFGMRGSITRYYNTVEPINLRLSGVMTFFFSVLYFQYHFSRIARWKTTGRLD